MKKTTMTCWCWCRRRWRRQRRWRRRWRRWRGGEEEGSRRGRKRVRRSMTSKRRRRTTTTTTMRRRSRRRKKKKRRMRGGGGGGEKEEDEHDDDDDDEEDDDDDDNNFASCKWCFTVDDKNNWWMEDREAVFSLVVGFPTNYVIYQEIGWPVLHGRSELNEALSLRRLSRICYLHRRKLTTWLKKRNINNSDRPTAYVAQWSRPIYLVAGSLGNVSTLSEQWCLIIV